MKTDLQKKLSSICPSVSFSITWEYDPDGGDGNGPEGWQAWRAKLTAKTTHNGEYVTGVDYFTGEWEKPGMVPKWEDTDAPGYETDMLFCALGELDAKCNPSTKEEIFLAIKFLNQYEGET